MVEINKKYWGLNPNWRQLLQIKIIRETPLKYKVLKITEYGNYEIWYTKEWVKNNFFEDKPAAIEHIIKVIQEDKKRANIKYVRTIDNLNNTIKEIMKNGKTN
jgi:hypothetical protein